MTISTGVVVLIIVLAAWKMKGAQLPHVFLGMILMKSASAGSWIDTISGMGLEMVTTIVNAISQGIGQGHVV